MTCHNSFPNHPSLKLCEHSTHLEHHLSSRSRGVDSTLVDIQITTDRMASLRNETKSWRLRPSLSTLHKRMVSKSFLTAPFMMLSKPVLLSLPFAPEMPSSLNSATTVIPLRSDLSQTLSFILELDYMNEYKCSNHSQKNVGC